MRTLTFDMEGASEAEAQAALAAAEAWNVACGETLLVYGKGGMRVRFVHDEEETPAPLPGGGYRRGFFSGWENLEAGGVIRVYSTALRLGDDPAEVVAHEMGHALGLPHSEVGHSVMHERARRPLRASRPTAEDVRALEAAGYFCSRAP